MTRKSEYEQYLDSAAMGANLAGITHHNPMVQARQVQHGNTFAAFTATAGAPILGIFVLFMTFVGLMSFGTGLGAVLFSLNLLDCSQATGRGVEFTNSCSGFFVESRVLDGFLWLVLLLGFTTVFLSVSSRKIGYFAPIGLIHSAFQSAALFSGRDGELFYFSMAPVLLCFYLAFWLRGTPKSVHSIWYGIALLVGVHLAISVSWFGSSIDRYGAPPFFLEVLFVPFALAPYFLISGVGWSITKIRRPRSRKLI